MIIEFMGLPGSGKSTIARLVADRLADGAIRAYNLGGRAGLDGRKLNQAQRRLTQAVGLVRQPRLAAVSLGTMRHGRRPFEEMVGVCRRSDALRRLRKRDATGLLTEGPLGAICLASHIANDPGLIPRALAAAALPDAVISLAVSDESAAQRIRDRGHAFAQEAWDSQLDLIRGLRQAQATMLAQITIPVRGYDNEGDVAATVQQIADDLGQADRAWL